MAQGARVLFGTVLLQYKTLPWSVDSLKGLESWQSSFFKGGCQAGSTDTSGLAVHVPEALPGMPRLLVVTYSSLPVAHSSQSVALVSLVLRLRLTKQRVWKRLPSLVLHHPPCLHSTSQYHWQLQPIGC